LKDFFGGTSEGMYRTGPVAIVLNGMLESMNCGGVICHDKTIFQCTYHLHSCLAFKYLEVLVCQIFLWVGNQLVTLADVKCNGGRSHLVTITKCQWNTKSFATFARCHFWCNHWIVNEDTCHAPVDYIDSLMLCFDGTYME